MLVTDPKQRASLGEIANHVWMTKGFSSPPENYLPPREPLQLPLDPDVIKKMTGFDFGTTEYITTHLTKILQSDDYQRAVRNSQRKQLPGQTTETEQKRGVFNFYKRRNSASRDTLTNPSNEAVHFGEDPVNAYAPMISIYYLVREKMERERRELNPGALEIPSDKPLKMPDLPAPEAAYTNASAYEMAGEAPTGGRTRPRARTHGEDEVSEGIQKMHLQQNDGPPAIVAPADTPVRKESAAAGLLRRFSTRRKQREPSEPAAAAPIVNISSPTDASPVPPRKSFSVRRTRTNDGKEGTPSSASLHVTGSQKHQPELLTPPPVGEGSFPKRFMSLRRSTSVDRRRIGKQRGTSEGEPPPTSGSDNSSYHSKKPLPGDAAGSTEEKSPRPSGASRAKSLGHARRESIQARRAKRAQANQDHLNVPEETEAELAKEKEVETDHEPTVQPVLLKGFFSVSTTSSKPLSYIQKDIVRVLHQRGLEYEEIKGGFLCTHYPEIERPAKHNVHEPGQENLSPNPDRAHGGHRRKISFNALMGNSTEKDREEFLRAQAPQLRSPRTPRDAPVVEDDGTDFSDSEDRAHRYRLQKPHYSGRARNPGETSTRVRDDVGEDTMLRFQIFIVKIPVIGLHGLQFKKVEGNVMHYKDMAQDILKSLRL